MKSRLAGIGLSLVSMGAFAANLVDEGPPVAPQPTTCIVGNFTSTGDNTWQDIVLTVTNTCDKPVDFQNTTINFISSIALNTVFWGDFEPLSHPDNDLKITSVPQTDKTFLAGLSLHFPTRPGVKTTLPEGKSFTIKYGAPTDSHVGAINVYPGTPAVSGSLALTNLTKQPVNVTQNYALVHLSFNNQNVSDVELTWGETQTLPNLAPGVYVVSPESVTDSLGNTYNGTATPASITVTQNQVAKANVSYALASDTGKITIDLQALPAELAGYTEKPTATLTHTGSSGGRAEVLEWGAAATVSKLWNGDTYTFSTPAISYNGYLCSATFTPPSLVADGTKIPSTSLNYRCIQTIQNNVTINVSGAPATLNTLHVTLTPNNGAKALRQAVSLNGGVGSSVVKLTQGTVYAVTSFAVPDYVINYNPKQLTSQANAVEDITLTKSVATPVEIHGQLHVCGVRLCNQYGQPIQLRGLSTHGLQWYGWTVCLTPASLDNLTSNWGASVIRLSMYVQEGGYETDPAGFTAQMQQLIQEASQRGIYAIVDWHILTPGDPNANLISAKQFFTDIATANKGKVNLIYEIASAPNGVSWDSIKRYAEQIIPVIRAIDPKAVILVGTRGHSSLGLSEGGSSQEIIKHPVSFANVMYAFHFYAKAERDNYLDELDAASKTLPIFVSEFGMQNADGDGDNDVEMTDKFMQLMAKKKIGWAAWNYSDDAKSGAVWNAGTCATGAWLDTNLKPAGLYIKQHIQ